MFSPVRFILSAIWLDRPLLLTLPSLPLTNYEEAFRPVEADIPMAPGVWIAVLSMMPWRNVAIRFTKLERPLALEDPHDR